MKCFAWMVAAWALLVGGSGQVVAGFITFSNPSWAFGVDGSNVVGYYVDANGVQHAFFYDGSTSTTLPGSAAYAVSGNYVVGDFGLYNGSTGTITKLSGTGFSVSGDYVAGSGVGGGFLYNISTSTYTTLPTAGALSVSGKYVVGEVGGTSSFLYNISTSTYTDIKVPGASTTLALGISGNNVVGFYNNSKGFIYDLSTSTYTTLDFPGSVGTRALAVDGNNVVGGYFDSSGIQHNLLYDGTTFTTLNIPGATSSLADGVSGNNVVGLFDGRYGYFYDPTLPTDKTVNLDNVTPEPATITLLAIGIAGMAGYAWRRRKQQATV
jgi:PEP-CTERM motif